MNSDQCIQMMGVVFCLTPDQLLNSKFTLKDT